MKKTITLLSITVGLFAFTAQAQIQTVNVGNLAASSTRTYLGSGTNYAIDTSAQQNVSVEVRGVLLGAGTSACSLVLSPALDSTNYNQGVLHNIVVSEAGTVPFDYITNFTVAGYKSLQLLYVTNGSANVLTNLTIRYWIKQNAP